MKWRRPNEFEYDEKDPLYGVADNWNWGRAQPCNTKSFCKGGRRTLQMCYGSLECPNLACAFKRIHKSPNKVDFSRNKKCTHCKTVPKEIEFSARKYVENDRCHKKMTVIYLGGHTCQPRVREKKPNKTQVENTLRVRPTMTSGQLQIDTIREASLSGKSRQDVRDVAVQYSNKRHLNYLQSKIQQKTRPGGSDIEAVHLLKDDFTKRDLDDNLILKVGDGFVILSSEPCRPYYPWHSGRASELRWL